jgi:hypothetical protein
MLGLGWLLWCVELRFVLDEIVVVCVFIVLAGGWVLGQEIRAEKVVKCGNYD